MAREYEKPESLSPETEIKVTFTDEGRKIEFLKECEGDVEIFRRVNGLEWLPIARGVRPPYIDADELSPGKVEYFVRLIDRQGKEVAHKEVEVKIT